MIPVSPKTNRNAMTPTSGGRATGSTASRARRDRRGNRYWVKTNARNSPIMPLKMTETTDTKTEFPTASRLTRFDISNRKR